MPMNYGKKFENNFKKGVGKELVRLYDTTNGYAGVKNPCDFIYYRYPYQYLFELKSVKGSRFDFSNITDNQKEQLDFYSHIKGCNPMVVVEFRDYKEVYMIPWSTIKRTIANNKQSLTIHDCAVIVSVCRLPVEYQRINFKLDKETFNSRIFLMAQLKECADNE
jgi:recombination protein U